MYAPSRSFRAVTEFLALKWDLESDENREISFQESQNRITAFLIERCNTLDVEFQRSTRTMIELIISHLDEIDDLVLERMRPDEQMSATKEHIALLRIATLWARGRELLVGEEHTLNLQATSDDERGAKEAKQLIHALWSQSGATAAFVCPIVERFTRAKFEEFLLAKGSKGGGLAKGGASSVPGGSQPARGQSGGQQHQPGVVAGGPAAMTGQQHPIMGPSATAMAPGGGPAKGGMPSGGKNGPLGPGAGMPSGFWGKDGMWHPAPPHMMGPGGMGAGAHGHPGMMMTPMGHPMGPGHHMGGPAQAQAHMAAMIRAGAGAAGHGPPHHMGGAHHMAAAMGYPGKGMMGKPGAMMYHPSMMTAAQTMMQHMMPGAVQGMGAAGQQLNGLGGGQHQLTAVPQQQAPALNKATAPPPGSVGAAPHQLSSPVASAKPPGLKSEQLQQGPGDMVQSPHSPKKKKSSSEGEESDDESSSPSSSSSRSSSENFSSDEDSDEDEGIVIETPDDVRKALENQDKQKSSDLDSSLDSSDEDGPRNKLHEDLERLHKNREQLAAGFKNIGFKNIDKLKMQAAEAQRQFVGLSAEAECQTESTPDVGGGENRGRRFYSGVFFKDVLEKFSLSFSLYVHPRIVEGGHFPEYFSKSSRKRFFPKVDLLF